MKIGMSGIWYPMAILRYFHNAIRRTEHEVVTAGPFSGNWIPWLDGMYMDNKYVYTPDVAFPLSIGNRVPSNVVSSQVGHVDIWIQVDAGFHFSNRPDADCVVSILTDPHALDKTWYDEVRGYSDFVFNMQTPYMEKGDIHLPYAYDPGTHFPVEVPKEYDVSMIGLAYPNRLQMVDKLCKHGVTCNQTIGVIWDEYRVETQKARVGFTWSSQKDLIARVYEYAAMRMPFVTNDVPDMELMGFVGGDNCLTFNTLENGFDAINFLLHTPDEADRLAYNAYNLVYNNHTYDNRISLILETIK